MTAHLRCLACDARFPLAAHYACPECGGELDVQYDHERIRADGELALRWRQPGPMASRFAEFMPLSHPEAAVTLGEGNTPLVRSRNLAGRLGLRHLYFKLEGANPTGSFKDRQVAIAISKALELGQKRFATVSSGNVGNALAAYAAYTGSQADIWVSHETAAAKRQQIEIYGARVFLLPSPRGSDGPGAYFSALRDLPAFCARQGLAPMISARSVNPYMVEGAKAIAYEIAATLGRNPDVVFTPVGGGGLAGGIHKGFSDLVATGLADTLPRLHGGQRRAYFAPIDHMDEPQYRSGYYLPLDGHWAWGAIQASHGTLRVMEDDAIRAAQADLARHEGIFAEPHGAYAMAALSAAAAEGRLDPDALTVCIVSGFGLKDMAAAAEIVAAAGRPPIEVASLQASEAYFVSPAVQEIG
jgi:threonine synthase